MAPKKRPAASDAADQAVLKRPAAAPASEDPDTKDWTLAKIDTGDLVEDEDAPDGVYDDRTASRAQRHVFENNETRIDPVDWKRYWELRAKGCTEAGKTRAANAIINAYVPRNVSYRGQVEKKTNTLEKMLIRSTTKTDSEKQVGLKLNTFIASIFHGNEELFKKAKEEKEVWQENGLWYYEKNEKTATELMQERKRAIQEDHFQHDEEMLSIMAEMHEESKKPLKWRALGDKIDSGSAPSRFESDDKKASEADMKLLQECFDSVTRLTLSTRKVGTSLAQKAGSDAVRDLARKGLDILKKLVVPTQDVEALLMTPLANVKAKDIAKAIDHTSKPYKECLDYYKELERMYEKHVGKMEKGDKAMLKIKK
eukprot:1081761-Pyramimonas_sp.AAC.1